ncbi:MAG: peroxiredoxin [Candidatus Hodarchaeota archaeon]
MVDIGDMAPEFTLLSEESSDVSLKNYRGKKVILYFYPKDGTPGCTQEAKEFKDLADEFDKENVIILGISKDSVQSHQKFKEKNQLPFTLLSDPVGKVTKLYGVGKTIFGTARTTFLIDEQGTIKKIYKKVKPKEHAKTCLLDLSKI